MGVSAEPITEDPLLVWVPAPHAIVDIVDNLVSLKQHLLCRHLHVFCLPHSVVGQQHGGCVSHELSQYIMS